MKRVDSKLVILALLLIPLLVNGQPRSRSFTHQDTLRGSITKERAWWDLKYYHLDITINPSDSTLKGSNTIRYQVINPMQVMQIDLQEPMKILNIYQNDKPLSFTRDGNAWYIQLQDTQNPGDVNEILVQYEGRPRISRNPPWSGGLSWKRDKNNNPFIVTTCQGEGASIWWPCKDHQSDEPDSMLISVTVPEKLFEVSNGRLRSVTQNVNHTKTFNWFVSNPINNYGVNMNIADYAHFSEKYQGEKGVLDCDYYVLRDNLEKAKVYFQEVKRMLEAHEHWFGPYPFYEDSYKLVEVPYAGMEHQSSVTYGNGYTYGYGGHDESHTGWGMKFDFIIIHESAHEWFGNSITSRDIADMWIHESFGAYSESLFVDYHYGKQAGNEYCIGTRANIGNRSPIIGSYNVNAGGSGDMYSKGANMLHTLRQIVNDDEKFRGILRGASAKFYHQTITTEQMEAYLAEASGMDLKPFFNQYLRTVKIPVFEYSVEGTTLKYRWNNCVDGFNIPLKIKINDQEKWIAPTAGWAKMDVPESSTIVSDPNFYILTKPVSIPYKDVNQPIEVRVNDLVSRMTVEEKISQMQHTAPAIERLDIPAYNWWNEALHGVARNGIATVFPQAIAMAATWNPGLINQEADIISTEARAKYYEAIGKNEHGIYQGLTFWSPNINIFRDPRWGRGQETYGEDPYLTSQIGVAFVKGLQGTNEKYFKVLATAKHFAVHSGPESTRHSFDAWPSETDLYETYLPAFEALAMDAGVYSFMGAYNRVYGTPACANDLLLGKILRGKWGFKGYVESDCWAISDFYNFHKFVPDAAKASALAVKAGTDLACGDEYVHLNEAVKLGYISEAEIDTAVKRLFTARMKLGMFDPPEMVPYSSIKPADNNTEANRQLARKVAQESIVLLKNENSTLPLSAKIRSIAVIGPYADEISVLLGNYNGTPAHPVTLLQGIKNHAGKNIRISYAIGVYPPEKLAKDSTQINLTSSTESEAVRIASKSEVIVFAGGISPELEGEEMPVKIDGFSGGDRTHLDIPASQQRLLEKLNALHKPLILVLTNGSALSINWAKENIPAIVDTWYPGEEGGNALADVLFGNYNPAGRLPVTFYKSINDIPPFDDYNMQGKTYRYFAGDPLFAFGYGLSYSKFDYSKLETASKRIKAGDPVKINVTITNSGKYDGDEVVQVYVRQPKTVAARPIQSLAAFKRIHLKKGESQIVQLEISPKQLRHFDSKLGDYAIAGGYYEIFAGAASDDIRAKAIFEVK